MNRFISLLSIVALFTISLSAQVQGFKYFITVDGHKLMDGNKEFRFISQNIPNLNYVEDEMSFTAKHPYGYPNEFEIRDALESVKQMGGKVVRIYTIPVKRETFSDDVPTFVTGPGQFVEEAFVVNDLMLKIANETGVRIIFSFLNNWKWMGGAPQYAAFRGKKFDDFWTDKQLIEDFKKTIEFTINRTNTLTGVKYKDDKAILCWETGNELMNPTSWLKEIAAYIKSLDKNHLLMDGYFAIDNQRYVREESIQDPNIDIVSSHHYEQDPIQQIDNIKKNLSIIKGRKPYMLGELGFESTTALERIYDYIIAENEICGTFNWSLRYHHRNGGFYWHSEPVGHNLYKAYHWPGFKSGEDYDETNMQALMRRKAYEINGEEMPELPKPKAPKLLPIEKNWAISWQGSVGASGYNIERSENKNGPWKEIAYNVSDAAVQYFPLFNDESADLNKSYYYRVKALNRSGISEASNVVGPVTTSSKAFIDELQNLMKLYSYKKVVIDNEQDRRFKENTERGVGEKGSEIVYFVKGNITNFNIYSFEQNKENSLKIYTSHDGKTYQEVKCNVSGDKKGEGDYGYWDAILYNGSNTQKDISFLKIEYQAKSQIARVEIEYN